MPASVLIVEMIVVRYHCMCVGYLDPLAAHRGHQHLQAGSSFQVALLEEPPPPHCNFPELVLVMMV